MMVTRWEPVHDTCPAVITCTRQVNLVKLTHDAIVFVCTGTVKAEHTGKEYTFEIGHNELSLDTRSYLWGIALGNAYVLPTAAATDVVLSLSPLVISKQGVNDARVVTANITDARKFTDAESSTSYIVFVAEDNHSLEERDGSAGSIRRRPLQLLYPEVQLLCVTAVARQAILARFDYDRLNAHLASDEGSMSMAVRVEHVNGLLESKMNQTAAARCDAYRAIEMDVAAVEQSLVKLATQLRARHKDTSPSSGLLEEDVCNIRQMVGDVRQTMTQFKVESGMFDDTAALKLRQAPRRT